MKKITYTFNKVDYESHGKVVLIFNVIKPSIQTFIELVKSKNLRYKTADSFFKEGSQDFKSIVVGGFPKCMYNLLIDLGYKDHSEIFDNIYVRHNRLKVVRIKKRIEWDKIYIRFNSITKETKYVYNTPFVISRMKRQGKILWRRYH